MGFDGRRDGGAIGNVVVVERKRQLGGRVAGFLGLRSTCTGDGHRIVVDGAEITARCLPCHLGGFIATRDRNIGGSGRHLVRCGFDGGGRFGPTDVISRGDGEGIGFAVLQTSDLA